MKLNAKPKSLKTINQAAYPAYKMGDKLNLVTQAATSFWKEPKFYGEADEQAKAFIELAEVVATKDAEFVFKLARYCRQELHLRTVSVVLFVVAANHAGANVKVHNKMGVGLARKYAPEVIARADEVMEAVAFQIQRKGSKENFPKNLQRGLADVLLSFDEYQLAKYDQDGEVKLKDAIILLHPKPKTKVKAALLKRALEGKLKTPKTWEVEISTKGSTKENWEKIAPEMGYFALIRNLRNFLEKGCKMKPILKRIEDSEEVEKSKLLPFRFLAAYKVVQGITNASANDVLEAISKAFDASMQNVPELKGTTAVLVDHSGSMNDPLSAKSDLTRFHAAACLAAIVNAKSKQSITAVFNESAKVVNIRKNAGIDVIDQVTNAIEWGGTNTASSIQLLLSQGVKVDRVILLTDEQQNAGDPVGRVWAEYRKLINPKAVLYAVDLAGYGTSSFTNSNGVVKLAGFSEKLLDLVRTVESGGFEKMVETIEKSKS